MQTTGTAGGYDFAGGTAGRYSAGALSEEEEGAVGRLLAMLSSTSCGACTAGVLAVEDEEAAGFISLSVTAYK